MPIRIALIIATLLLGGGGASASDTLGDKIGFSVIVTARSGGAQEAMVVAGGSWLNARKLVQTAVLIRHPQGDLLWDSGIGTEIASQMEEFSFIERQLFKIEDVRPAIHQLRQSNYPVSQLKAIIPSHMHWDHISALEDFVPTPVWVQKNEYEAARAGSAPAFIFSQFDSPDINWKFIELKNEKYQGFDKSLDVYGDGQVVLVDLSGHTKGQLGLFLTTPDHGRYFFIGDTTWVLKGVETAKSRPVFVSWLADVDQNVDKNAEVISKIHALSKQDPELVIVPAHDERVNSQLPIFPELL